MIMAAIAATTTHRNTTTTKAATGAYQRLSWRLPAWRLVPQRIKPTSPAPPMFIAHRPNPSHRHLIPVTGISATRPETITLTLTFAPKAGNPWRHLVSSSHPKPGVLNCTALVSVST